MAYSIKRAIERDKEQTIFLKQNNWIVLRFWDNEIDKNIDECFYKIKTITDNR